MKVMKKFDVKKIGIIAAIVVVIVLAIFLIGKAIKGNSIDEQSLEKYEKLTTEYLIRMSYGYNTPYFGLETSFTKDELKVEDLNNRQLLSVAINYITLEDKVSEVDYKTIIALHGKEYPQIESSALYKAEDIRLALKEIFGIENFANPSVEADYTYLISYTYLNDEDIYIVTAKEENSIVDKNQFIDYSIIETKAKNDKLVTTVAIAYAYSDGESSQYATDMYGENIVAEKASKFPTEKIDEFTKYEFTFTKSKDGKNYIFESIKKVK